MRRFDCCETGEHLLAAVRSGAGVEHPALRFRRGDGVIGWVIEKGQPVLLHDARKDARFKRKLLSQRFVIGSMAAVGPWRETGRYGAISWNTSQRASGTREPVRDCSSVTRGSPHLSSLRASTPHWRRTCLLQLPCSARETPRPASSPASSARA